ncbi:DUF4350 domain-containing protein [Qipengyuania sp. ASV99]|uniref:DUF4350 domain-containing protein n=1 Tax=Qipengyuania sp. ASV99 TaxID=3399681 RepID=UPI003A4C52AA
MSAAEGQMRGASPFSRGAVLSVVLVGFTAFVAMLYFIGIGDTGGRGGAGPAHAYANGLNGYAALAELLESEGFDVELSRGREGLETTDLLILTPPPFTDAAEFAELLENRAYLGPTLVILPKWSATKPEGEVAEEDAERVQSDWVELIGSDPVDWTKELPAPFAFEHKLEELAEDEAPAWEGLGFSGELPTRTITYAEPDSAHDPYITDAAGHVLALNVVGEEGSDYYENSHWTMFVLEPDLMNNYGLADPERAAAALALVREAGYSDLEKVTFDLTQNGYGDTVNLLTLAFRPPFLAATICLILALLIVGWRAFLRFGPVAASAPEIAFGKRRLVSNGAGLIVRARRLGLLAEPYVALIERRLGRALGIAKPDAEAIDSALRQRLPSEEPFSSLADRLRLASKPNEILRAAQALNALTGKIAR